MHTNFEKYKSWSLIDPKPVILYSDYHGEYLAMWNGMLITYSAAYALMVYCLSGIYINPVMKKCIWNDSKRILFNDILKDKIDPYTFEIPERVGADSGDVQQQAGARYWYYLLKKFNSQIQDLKKSHSIEYCIKMLDVENASTVSIYDKIG